MIQRYFSSKSFGNIQNDFRFLAPILRSYYGEIEFSIRNNYFNLYYKGNSLSKVKVLNNCSYEISINKKFFDGSKAQDDPRFKFERTKDTYYGILKSKVLHQFFQKKYINNFCSKIRIVNNGEEINFEQAIITDNMDNKGFFIIDRQITDTELQRKRMDLLALKNLDENRYGFVVVEVKLGKNNELKEKVAGQLAHYIDHIMLHLNDYAECYEKNYQQKKELGLLSIPFDSIIIDRKKVEGLVVVGGYSNIADEYILTLNKNYSIKPKRFKFQLS